MKTTSIRITFFIFLTLFAAVFDLLAADTLNVDTTATPAFKAFLANYVAAINSKDRAKLNECIHPTWVTKMAKDQKFSDSWYGGRFAYSIPTGFKVSATASAADKPLPPANQGVVWPVKPTYQVQIDFKPTPTNPAYMVLWVASENDKWYEVLPSAPDKKIAPEQNGTLRIEFETSNEICEP